MVWLPAPARTSELRQPHHRKRPRFAWQWDGSQWKLFYANGTPYPYQPAGDQLLLGQQQINCSVAGREQAYPLLSYCRRHPHPANALVIANQTWMADRQNGLVRFRPGGYD